MDGVAKDILNPHVVCVTEDMEWRRAAELLKDEAITGAPVVDDQGQVVGIIGVSADHVHGFGRFNLQNSDE